MHISNEKLIKLGFILKYTIQEVFKLSVISLLGNLMEACLWGFYGGWIFELQ